MVFDNLEERWMENVVVRLNVEFNEEDDSIFVIKISLNQHVPHM